MGGGGEAEVERQTFRNIGARRWRVVNTTLWPLYPLEKPDALCTVGCVGLGAGIDGHGELLVYRQLNTGLSEAQPVVIAATLTRQHFINRKKSVP